MIFSYCCCCFLLCISFTFFGTYFFAVFLVFQCVQVKKRQQHALLILDTVKIDYKVIDITEPGHEEERELMKEVCKKRNSESLPLPPQFFNEDEYCGVSECYLENVPFSLKECYLFNVKCQFVYLETVNI